MFRRTQPVQSPLGQLIGQLVARAAKNPEVQRQMQKYAKEAGKYTAQATAQAKQQWNQHVEPKIKDLKQQAAAAASAGAAAASDDNSNKKSEARTPSFGQKRRSQQSSASSESSSSSSSSSSSATSSVKDTWRGFFKSGDKPKNESSSSSNSTNSNTNDKSKSGSSETGTAWTVEMRARAFFGRLQARVQNYWSNFNMARDFMTVMIAMQMLSGVWSLIFHQGKEKGAHSAAQKVQEKKHQQEIADLEKKKAEEALKNQDTLKAEGGLTSLGDGDNAQERKKYGSRFAKFAEESTLEGSALAYAGGGDSPITILQRQQQEQLRLQQGGDGNSASRRGQAPFTCGDDPFRGSSWNWPGRNQQPNPNRGEIVRPDVSSAGSALSSGVISNAAATKAAGGFDQSATSNFSLTQITFNGAQTPDRTNAVDPMKTRQFFGTPEGVETRGWFSGSATQKKMNQMTATGQQ